MSLSCSNTRKKHLLALCWSLGLNLMILIIAFAFSHMELGTNDDRDISNLLANVTGTMGSYYITFVNVILCKFLAVLYSLTGNCTNWYVLLSVIASFCALTAMGYVLILRSPKIWFGACLTALMLGLLYENHYIVFQFTQNAALLTLAGSILLADGILFGKKETAMAQYAVGIALAVLGSMIRFQSIVFTFPYLIMYMGYEIVFLRKPQGFKPWLKERLVPFAAVGICLVLVFAARGIHNYIYSSDPELRNFNEENLLRAELLDYGFPSYEENAEELQALGISQEDMELFSKQCFLDKEVYNREVLEAMVRMKSEQSASYSAGNLKLSQIPTILAVIRTDLGNTLVWQAILLSCILFLGCTAWRRWLVALGSLAAPMAMMWYFISVNRMPHRIWYSIVAPAVVSMLYLCTVGCRDLWQQYAAKDFNVDKAFQFVHKLCAAALVIAVILVGVSVYQRAERDDSVLISDTYEEILDLAAEYPTKLFLLDRPTVSSLTYRSTITPMTALESGSHSNVCYQGGWVCWTPGNLSVLENFGVTNVYQAIGEGMDVFLIDGRTPEMKLEFIRRHYNPQVCMKQIGTINGSNIGVYRFYIPESTTTPAP